MNIKMNKTKLSLSLGIIALLLVNLATAITVKSVDSSAFSPGKEGTLSIEIKNTFNDDVEEVSFSLDLTNVPFTPIGSSEESVDEILEGDTEDFAFRLKAANNIEPGDYKIPYTIFYVLNGEQRKINGSIGITVGAAADLTFSITTDTPVVGSQGKINLKIVNKGFGDAKFVSVKIVPDRYTVLSEDQIYLGTINSDDFETATFNVIFNNQDTIFTALVDYMDFNNQKMSKSVNMPLTVYTQEEAVKLGIIKKSNLGLYIGIILLLIIIWIVYRAIRARRRRSRRINSESR